MTGTWIKSHNLLTLPAIIVAGSVSLPLAYLIVRSLGAGPGIWELIFRYRTLELIMRTLALVMATTVASLCISLPLAWLTSRTDLPFRRFWSVVAMVPLAIPCYIGAFSFIAAFGPGGMFPRILADTLGVYPLPDIYGFEGAVLVLTLFTYPYIYLPVKVALSGGDQALEELSRSLGFGRFQTFFRVTLPQLRPAIVSGGLLVALYTLSEFGAVALLQYDTFTRVIFIQYKASFDRSYAAALSLILIILTVSILAAEFRLRNRARYYRNDSGTRRVLAPVSLGKWRWPALLFCGGIAFLALVIPASTLSYWLWRGYASGGQFSPVLNQAWNAVQASVAAAAVTGLAALPVALLAVRFPNKLSLILERLSLLGYGLPGIVIAFSLVFFGAQFVRPLYQTFLMLVFAYMIRFLPQSVGTTSTALLRINPHLEEAARSLGRKSRDVLATITWPLIRPGVLAGIALVFLSSMKELEITLLLAPTGFRTLATTVWGATEEAFYARAALPALLLIFIAFLSLLGLIKQTER